MSKSKVNLRIIATIRMAIQCDLGPKQLMSSQELMSRLRELETAQKNEEHF